MHKLKEEVNINQKDDTESRMNFLERFDCINKQLKEDEKKANEYFLFDHHDMFD